jgi:endoglucanase
MTGTRTRLVTVSTAALALSVLAAACSGQHGNTRPPGTAVRPQVRVNQVGYPLHGPKTAFVMLARPASSVRFTVSGPAGVVYRGVAGRDLGPWNGRYRAVYPLGFTALTRPGDYRVTVTAGGASAASPGFALAPPSALYHRLVVNAVRYFTSERDGPDVLHSVLSREPANLTDGHATVYAAPKYSTDGNDTLLGPFRKTGGPVDVAGGWFDAGGGYEKFAYTASYADALMMIAARAAAPGAYPTLGPEAQFGLRWLAKLWDPARKVLYIQVGIGNGNAAIHGDYDFWFLPQAEDRLNVSPGGTPGPSGYYVRYRPVFEAAPPGQPIAPDLAGRFAAAFALGAQLAAASDHGEAVRLLALARSVYAMARTTHVGQLITTYPHDYYPGSEWTSDMLWGAAEITLAQESLHAPAPQLASGLAAAGRWARAYLAQGHPAGGDTFNLYDTGAVAEAELLRAMRQAGVPPPVPAGALLADLAAQLRLGERYARSDPFSPGVVLGQGDATPHAFGLFITDALYQEYGGSGGYRAFAQQQLNFALGANAWGSSFVAGAGTTFPHCMQSEIANLAGSLNGAPPLQLGVC